MFTRTRTRISLVLLLDEIVFSQIVCRKKKDRIRRDHAHPRMRMELLQTQLGFTAHTIGTVEGHGLGAAGDPHDARARATACLGNGTAETVCFTDCSFVFFLAVGCGIWCEPARRSLDLPRRRS